MRLGGGAMGKLTVFTIARRLRPSPHPTSAGAFFDAASGLRRSRRGFHDTAVQPSETVLLAGQSGIAELAQHATGWYGRRLGQAARDDVGNFAVGLLLAVVAPDGWLHCKQSCQVLRCLFFAS